MRIVVVGTSGAGKTTLARRIAALLELPHIELDAINWQSGWGDLTRHDPEEFVRRVNEAIKAEAWVVDGNYGPVRDRVWQRATHLLWLDYERPVIIMARVISRTLFRAVLRTELWAGNRERWRRCCGSATRSAGPGIPGSAAAAKPQSAWRRRNAHISRCCGCTAQAKYLGQSSS
jgi:adenylate kinase family enzyme